MTEVKSYHAHVYFDAESRETAHAVIDATCAQFDVQRGRIHENAVDPHPVGSCQLAFSASLFGDLVPWLSQNRRGLTIFIHGITGDDMRDHTELVIWLGKSVELRLEALQ